MSEVGHLRRLHVPAEISSLAPSTGITRVMGHVSKTPKAEMDYMNGASFDEANSGGLRR
jgi:hypothetical protein